MKSDLHWLASQPSILLDRFETSKRHMCSSQRGDRDKRSSPLNYRLSVWLWAKATRGGNRIGSACKGNGWGVHLDGVIRVRPLLFTPFRFTPVSYAFPYPRSRRNGKSRGLFRVVFALPWNQVSTACEQRIVADFRKVFRRVVRRNLTAFLFHEKFALKLASCHKSKLHT